MNLQDLRYLVAVADHRHFGRAAEACFVSQPTLSTQLRKLERELGVELVERSPRHVLLTDVGERVVERARNILHEADAIGDLARQAGDPEAATLRIGLIPTLGPYLLPHVIPEVHRRFPRLELLLVEEQTDAVLADLRDGSIDAGVLALPVASGTAHVEPLFDEEFVLALPADHPLAEAAGADDTVPSAAIAGERLLLLEEGHCLRDQALSFCSLAGAGERADFRATSLETLRQMVAAGVGTTLLPRLSVAPPVPPTPGVVLRRFGAPAPDRRIAMIWRPTSVHATLLPRLADVFRQLPAGLVAPLPPT